MVKPQHYHPLMRGAAWTAVWIPLLLPLAGCGSGPATPWSAAAAAGRTEEVRTLLAQGADVNAKDGNLGTALIGAARQGRIETISPLLGAGADPNLRGGRNDWTPLMHAIHKNQRQSVRALLEGGADVNAKTRTGLTALMMAAGYGYAEIVRELLARGADPRAQTIDGSTALAAAVGGVPDIDRFTVCSCQTETVKALLEAAPNLMLKTNLPGRAARWFARLGRCSEVLQLLDRQPASRAGL